MVVQETKPRNKRFHQWLYKQPHLETKGSHISNGIVVYKSVFYFLGCKNNICLADIIRIQHGCNEGSRSGCETGSVFLLGQWSYGARAAMYKYRSMGIRKEQEVSGKLWRKGMVLYDLKCYMIHSKCMIHNIEWFMSASKITEILCMDS